MADAVLGARRSRGARLTPAELYLWLWGAVFAVLGVAGLWVNRSFAVGGGVEAGLLLGTLETNGWHAGASVVTATVALAFARTARATAVAGLIGAFLVATSLVFLAYGDDSVALWIIPVDTPDNVMFHLFPGLWGVAAWALTSRRSR